MLKKHICQVFRIHIRSAGDEMAGFGEAVGDYPDRVVAVRPREASHEVHRDILPGSVGDRERAQDAIGSVSGGAGALAWVAIADETVDILLHLRPVVGSFQQF